MRINSTRIPKTPCYFNLLVPIYLELYDVFNILQDLSR